MYRSERDTELQRLSQTLSGYSPARWLLQKGGLDMVGTNGFAGESVRFCSSGKRSGTQLPEVKRLLAGSDTHGSD